MKKIALILVAASATFLTACSVSPVSGAVNVSKWDGPISNPGIQSLKSGEACAQSILGLVAFGDASIETAKRSAGISKVATVDHRTLNVLYFFGQYCTIVHGE